jgi:hypothetical protein
MGIFASALVLTCASCLSRDLPRYVPDTVGVVKERTLVGNELIFEFKDRRTFRSPANMQYIGGSQPAANDLLIAGIVPGLWVYRATPETQSPPNRPRCYRLFGETHTDGAHVRKTVQDATRGDLIIVFPMAAGWIDVGTTGDRLHGATTCINEAGEAFEQRFASAEG